MSEQRGGARPGAGRKPKALSAKRIDAMLKAARSYRRKYGKSPEELLMDVAYKVGDAEDATLAQQLKALGLYFQHTMPSMTWRPRICVAQMGVQAAILAHGEVVTEVGPVKLDPGDPFILDRNQFPDVEPSVYLLIEKVFCGPIQKTWLQRHPGLKSLSVLHPPYQRTNFPVRPNEAKILDALARQAAGFAALSDVYGP